MEVVTSTHANASLDAMHKGVELISLDLAGCYSL